MSLWSRLRGSVQGALGRSARDEPLSRVRWIDAHDNPFGVELLDCRSFAQSMLAVSGDPRVAESYALLRASLGEECRGQAPHNPETHDCDLRYPAATEPPEGPLFKSGDMEEKWDIYHYDGNLYFARSWTGELSYRAQVEFREDATNIVAVTAGRAPFEADPHYPIAVVDFLIRSHVFGLAVPHPLPESPGRDPRQLALFSFSQYGRRGWYGTFADTTGLQPPALEDAEGPKA